MGNILYNYLTYMVRDVIFFSSDVQTTAIAVAIASSLCLSIIWAVCHVFVEKHLPQTSRAKKSSKFSSQNGSKSGSRRHSRNSSSSEEDVSVFDETVFHKVDVPCVRCKENFADHTCRFVTCRLCCFCPDKCYAHSRVVKPVPCRPYPQRSHGITEIDLRGRMDQCPRRIGFMGPQLTLLNLAQNNLSDLPPEIGCLRGLQELHLQKNQLSTIPDSIGTLVNLKVLTVSHNSLLTLPESVTQLSNVRHLDVGHNNLSSLPNSLTRMHKLRTLILSHNQLTGIPSYVCELQRLKKLIVSNNSLEVVPADIERLYQLETLDLSHCGLQFIPENLCHCSRLKQLNISSNRLTVLPVKLGSLRHLYKLSVANNCLQYLPSTLDLNKLNRCNVSGNPFLQKSCEPTELAVSFPPLMELTLRFISSQKSLKDSVHLLPKPLQDQLRNPKRCVFCHIPVFHFYKEALEFRTYQHNPFPYLTVDCSPHLTQHSQKISNN